MNYWLISDTHFNHLKLEDWGGRSGKWQDELWNSIKKIPRGDVLIHLGDICIGKDSDVTFGLVEAAREGGFKLILVRGNHDGNSTMWYQERGWDFACDDFHLLYMGHYIQFSHRPQRQSDKYTHNIHGHTHGNLHRSEEYIDFYAPGYHIDMSPELMGYKPVRLDTLMKMKPEQRKYPTA